MNIEKYMTIIIIIKFIILGVFIFLVSRYIKRKPLKIILTIVICLFILWTIIFTIDINRTNSLKEPIFARKNGYMGSMTRYDGLGYKIGLEKDHGTGHFSQSQMTILGQFVARAIQDFENDFIIVDETDNCDEVLEEIYRDNKHIYFLPCIQSTTIFLKYDNGEKITIKDALDKQKVSIEILIKKGLKVYQELIQN